MEGDRLSSIYHTPQHLDRLQSEDWEMLRNTGFPVDQLWHGCLLGEMEDEEDMEDCPQEQIMTVRQTTPALSEGDLFDEDLVDIDLNLLRCFFQHLVGIGHGCVHKHDVDPVRQRPRRGGKKGDTDM